ncbi:hypothetical protein CEXT_44971 [Caerostris extrusa]|uniref:Secreted protein n=1 Tax=Caerostris extrusa TaxID=172846 RepID=A0AAV4USU0_CAEEX|nr:hypothetical protein CEXT_44971 [Caerostris extrusa]
MIRHLVHMISMALAIFIENASLRNMGVYECKSVGGCAYRRENVPFSLRTARATPSAVRFGEIVVWARSF